MTKKQARAIREQIAREHPFVACASCHDGWVPDAVMGMLVRRCPCWHIHQAKVTALFEDRACAMDA